MRDLLYHGFLVEESRRPDGVKVSRIDHDVESEKETVRDDVESRVIHSGRNRREVVEVERGKQHLKILPEIVFIEENDRLPES